MTDKLNKILDLAPIENNNLPAVIPESEENDIEIAKASYRDLIAKSEEALEEMLLIAKQSQHPQAFNSLSKLIKTVAELHTGLLDIQKPKRKESNSETENVQTVNHNTQNIFVGTTAELAKLIENAKNEQLSSGSGPGE